MKNKIIEFIKTLYSKHVQRFLYKLKEHWIFYSAIGLTAVYLYGMIVSSFINAVHNFATIPMKNITINPIKCIAAVFTPYGLGITLYCHNVFIDTSELGRVYHGSENKKR